MRAHKSFFYKSTPTPGLASLGLGLGYSTKKITVVMIFGDFSVNSQTIFMKFYKHYFLVMQQLTGKCP